MMKKTTFCLAVMMSVVLSLWAVAGAPVQAQEVTSISPAGESLDTILARAAAKGFLVTLTRPELTSARSFYLLDGVRIDGILAELGDVTAYEITQAGWLKPGETYQVEARLQPGNRTIMIYTGKYNGRWRIEGVELAAPATGLTGTVPGAAGPVAGAVQPVTGNGRGRLAFQTQNGGDIYVINADGTGLGRVTHGLDPQLSPDGARIAFTRWEPTYELYTIQVDGSEEQLWFSGPRQMKSPTWTADGSRLVFSYQAGGRLEAEFKEFNPKKRARQIAEAKAKGEKISFPGIPRNARGVRINEKGHVEYTIPADAYWWLAQIDLNTNEYLDLSTGTRYNYAPSGHPTDLNRLIFRGDRGLAIYDAAAQVSYPLSFDDRDRGAVVVSPDGTKVALTYFQDGHWEIHTMNIDGSNRQRLTETPLRVVASSNRGNNEVIINEEGFRTMSRAQPGTMPNPSWNNAAPAWSPDGSKIAFVTDRTGKWEIWIMNADGSDQRPMFPNGALDGLTLNYAGVDERMISWR